MNDYRKFLKYGRSKQDIEDNYKMIDALITLSNKLFKLNSGYYARLFANYLSGFYNKEISLMLDRLDEYCVMQYKQNAITHNNKTTYKDWLIIDEKNLYPKYLFKTNGLTKELAAREYQKHYREMKGKEWKEKQYQYQKEWREKRKKEIASKYF